MTNELAEAIRATTPDFASTEGGPWRSPGRRRRPAPARRPARQRPLTRSTALARRLAEAPRAEVDHLRRRRRPLPPAARGRRAHRRPARGQPPPPDARAADRGLAVLVVLLAPLALVGFFTNLVPALIMPGRRAGAPGARLEGDGAAPGGGARLPLTWLVIAVWDVGAGFVGNLLQRLTFPLDPVVEGIFGTRGGFWPSVLVFRMAIPVLGFVALLFVERSWALLQDWTVWRALSTAGASSVPCGSGGRRWWPSPGRPRARAVADARRPLARRRGGRRPGA